MKYLSLFLLIFLGFTIISCSSNEDNPNFPLKFKFKKFQTEKPHIYLIKAGLLYNELPATGTFKDLIDDNADLIKEELDASSLTTELILLSDSLLTTINDDGEKDSSKYYIDNDRIITAKWPNLLLYDKVSKQIDNHFTFNSYSLHNKKHFVNLGISRVSSTELSKVINQTITKYKLVENDTCFVQQFKAIYLN